MRDQTKSKCKVALIDPKCPILPKMAKAVKDNLDGPKWLKNDLPTSVFKFSLQLIFGSPCWKAVTYTGLSTFLPKQLFWRDGTVTLVIIHIRLLYFGKPYHTNLAIVKKLHLIKWIQFEGSTALDMGPWSTLRVLSIRPAEVSWEEK